MCAITSAKLLKICATKASFIASGYHDSRRNYPVAHQARWIGLEIGAGCAPVAPKKQGFRVHVLDHCDKKALIEKYRRHEVNIENIEEVDFVWDGRSYTELIGRRHIYDWIIGSHVLEHTTDLIGFLNDCDSLLKKDGVLSLAVPDKRYCFDRFRPLSGIGRVIDAARNPQKIHSAGIAAEYFLTVVSKGGRIAWDAKEKGEFEFVHSLEQAKQAIRDVGERGSYLDVHEWCFTPTSFRLMMRDLFELGFIPLKELAFHPSQVVSSTSHSPVRACYRRAPGWICCRRFFASNPSPESH
jgi:2-polyprenyl-3-methyl-5-hydroxy-6-metoxy-1,4-benzoquinol methylase